MDNQEREMWIDMIAHLYTNLHNSEKVLNASGVSFKKRARLIAYFEKLEELHERVRNHSTKTGEKLLKNFYHELYVIKPENIPESYFQNVLRADRNNIHLTDSLRSEITKRVIEDQQITLDYWIDFFLYDEDGQKMAMWEKYWVFQGLLTLGKFNSETGKFSKRDKTTTYPFPMLDRESVIGAVNLMNDYLKNRHGEARIKDALGSGNFKALYEYEITQKLVSLKSFTTSGEWVKYLQGSDYKKLRASIQNYYTDWCTAVSDSFAKAQLETGDFYIYYSLDENGEAKVPRLAIRMDGKDKILEVRGVAKNQNIEPEMIEILKAKLQEFPDLSRYLIKEKNMQLLSSIANKDKNNIELSIPELRFLYEIDDIIEGFGFDKDPRVNTIKNKRDKKKDYSLIFNISPDQIALSSDEYFENPSKFKVLADSLVFDESYTRVNELVLPMYIEGDLLLNSMQYFKKLILPEVVGGSLGLRSLLSTRNLKLPKRVGGNLLLNEIISADNLILPDKVGGNLSLNSLLNADGLKMPQIVGGNLDMNSLSHATELVLPEFVGKDLNLDFLRSAKGIKFPKEVTWVVDLSSLETIDDLTLPVYIGDSLYLNSIEYADGLVLPKCIEGDVRFCSLKSAKGLVLPQSLAGELDISSLETLEGLKLPYNFDLGHLRCLPMIRSQILANPREYFQDNPNLEEKHYKSL